MGVPYQKIMVVGGCGGGKSTLSLRLAKHFSLPVYHLDQLFWEAGWVEPESDAWKKKHQGILELPHWVIDGNFRSTMTERLEKADLVIFVDMPRWCCVWGIVKRWWQHRGKTRPDMTEGCPERLNWEFLKYVWDFQRDNRPTLIAQLEAFRGEKPIHVLTNRKEVEYFLENLTASAADEVGG